MPDKKTRLRLGKKRQLTLPAAVCEALDIRPGALLDASIEGESLVLRPASVGLREALADISRALKEAGVTEKELLRSGREIRKEIFRETYPDLAEKYGI